MTIRIYGACFTGGEAEVVSGQWSVVSENKESRSTSTNGRALMTVQSYRDLTVWQKAMDFVVECYRSCEKFPRTEQYGLCSQLQRSSVSIPSNIAEGQGRNSIKEFLHHLSISYGSLMESETQIQIACRLGYITQDHQQQRLNQAEEIGRMLNGLMAALQKRLDSND
jgi:four helix bundle protein